MSTEEKQTLQSGRVLQVVSEMTKSDDMGSLRRAK